LDNYDGGADVDTLVIETSSNTLADLGITDQDIINEFTSGATGDFSGLGFDLFYDNIEFIDVIVNQSPASTTNNGENPPASGSEGTFYSVDYQTTMTTPMDNTANPSNITDTIEDIAIGELLFLDNDVFI